MARATLTRYRQSPRKVRRVADLIRGRRVSDALMALAVTPKRPAAPLAKLLKSAAANAVENEKKSARDLVVAEVRVDEGPTLHRFTPRAFGRARPIRKRTSHVTVTVV